MQDAISPSRAVTVRTMLARLMRFDAFPLLAIIGIIVVNMALALRYSGSAQRDALIFAAMFIPVGFAVVANWRAATLADDVARMEAEDDTVRLEIAGFAHDLKGPLATITSYLDLIAEGALGPVSDSTRAAARRGSEAAAQARGIVESTLLRHIESTAVRPPALDAVDLRALIGDVTEALRFEIAASHAEITVEPLPFVRGGQPELFRVFENVLQNAVKYARPGEAPIVSITGVSENGRAEIAIRDHGIGIPDADRVRVFDRTARSENAQGVASGDGLGLATVRLLVGEMDGEVWVDAGNDDDDGATVHISLPLAG